MKRNMLSSVLLSLLLLCLTACGEKQPTHTHTWDAANCTRGEFCFGCGKTQGEALGHDWVDATCAKAKHCSLCGKSEGNTLEHSSDGNGTCTICKQELDQVARMHLLNTEKECTVYDGVIVQMLFYGMPGEYGYLNDFEIYDQSGALVARGEFPPSVTMLVYDENQEMQRRLGLHSDFIPLPKGEYRILYHAYESFLDVYYDEDGNELPYVAPGVETDLRLNGNRCNIQPVGSLIAGSALLIVK